MGINYAAEILEEMQEEAKNALIVAGFWDKTFEGKELDVLTKLFLGSVRLLNQKTAALSTAIDIIERLNYSHIGGKVFQADEALEQINLDLACTAFEEYTPLKTTVN